MNLFNLFLKKNLEEKTRNNIRKAVDLVVKNALREINNEPFFSDLMIKTAIISYFNNIKSMCPVKIVDKSTKQELWVTEEFLEQEKDIAMKKYLNR